MPVPKSDDDSEDPYYDLGEKLNNVNDMNVKVKYDKDLTNYYYRAMNMDDSEFKYLAFYQVVECIFDEVYLHNNVQDIKHIINSNWFSSYRYGDITKPIKIIDQYNKNKNDREKFKLVLEKYFKGEVHDEAYYSANKEIIELLKNMKLINRDKDLNNFQKIANLAYYFRCKYTHSNRKFPFRTTFNDSSQELNNYIKLIRLISEKIIINYNSKVI